MLIVPLYHDLFNFDIEYVLEILLYIYPLRWYEI